MACDYTPFVILHQCRVDYVAFDPDGKEMILCLDAFAVRLAKHGVPHRDLWADRSAKAGLFRQLPFGRRAQGFAASRPSTRSRPEASSFRTVIDLEPKKQDLVP
jgi:hypothetical protein